MRGALVLAVAAALFHGGPLSGQDLTIGAGFEKDAWLDRRGGLELRPSRDLGADEGVLAVLIGATDVTSLFDASPGRLTWKANGIPLPSGEQDLVVYIVDPAGAWVEKARIPIKVRTRGGFEKATFQPALNVTNKGQIKESQYPETNFSARPTFQDGTMQGGWSSEVARGGTTFRTQLGVTGVTYVNEALRFGSMGERAPQVDLSGYTFELERGPARLALGHVSFGGQRHLIGGFSSRGALFTLGQGKAVSLHLAALNGTSIVGWDNFIGLSNQDHQMLGAGIGVEVFPSRPGALRIESWLLDGSLQPFDAYNQGAIRSAERSRGNAWRIALSDPSQRLTVEGGWSQSRFDEAHDVQLEEGVTVTPIASSRRDAVYADASLALVRDRAITPKTKANLTVGVHLEQVEPLYRSVAAFAQSDLLRRSADLTGNLGPFNLQLMRATLEDNLDDIPSILKTRTEQSGATAAIQLSSLTSDASVQPWLPTLSAAFNRTHQFGASIPVDSGFSAGHVPDQISRNATAGIDWTVRDFRFGYRWNASEQDNRQAGRERADFDAGSSGLSLGYSLTDRLALGLELSLDEQHSVETDRTDQTRRAGVNVNWRLLGQTSIATSYSKTLGRDDARTSESGSSDAYVELSSGFNLWRRAPGAPPANRAFVRYANRRSNQMDLTFGTADDRGGWTVSTGVAVNVLK